MVSTLVSTPQELFPGENMCEYNKFGIFGFKVTYSWTTLNNGETSQGKIRMNTIICAATHDLTIDLLHLRDDLYKLSTCTCTCAIGTKYVK